MQTATSRHGQGLRLACAALFLGGGMVAATFTVDDAFVVARVARNLVSGRGYAFNPHVVSDAVTGPLWLLPMIVGEATSIGGIAIAKACGAFAALAAVWLVADRARMRRHGRFREVTAWAALLSQSTLIVWPVAGLETGAATLALTVAALGAARPGPKAAALVGTSVAALAWLRPEAFATGCVCAAILWLRERPSGRVAVAIAVSGGLSVAAWRWHFFGAVLPLSHAAKPPELLQGARYIAFGLFVMTGCVGAALAGFGAFIGRVEDRVYGVVVLSHLAWVLLAGGDWMPGFRLLAPVLPLYGMLLGSGATHFFGRKPLVAGGIVVACCVVPATDTYVELSRVREAGRLQESRGWLLSRLVRSHAHCVAAVDIGRLGYETDLDVLDLGGITDPTIGRAPGRHLAKRLEATYVERRRPDLILLRSYVSDGSQLQSETERRVARILWVRKHFRMTRTFAYASRYHYVFLQRQRR